MAVEVQTWGTLGTMVAEQKHAGAMTQDYLEANEVYDLFGHLLRQVIVQQPANPIKFLQEQLKAKPPLTVCVIGPPGINRSKYCAQIANDYLSPAAHIHVGKLLSQRKELKDIIQSGSLVDDQIVIETVQAELKKHRNSGWVLDGFPRTKVQAQTLANKDMGFGLDKILLLNTGEQQIRERYAMKMAAYAGGDKDDLINTRLQQYQRHIISIVELFKNVIRQVEVSAGDDDQNIVYTTIKNCLHVRPYANAPLRPPRICLVGPCGSGRTTQCKVVAKQYGLVHVDLAPLIRAYQKANGMRVEDIPPEFMSDEEICAVVGKRLNQTDCLRKGWVLDGFPKTAAQAEFLRQSHLWPTRLIQIKIDEVDVANRLANRRVDPITCMAYYRNPNSVAVRQRLVQAEFDEPASVKARVKSYNDNIDRVLQTLPMVASSVNGNTDISELSRNIFARLDQALPTELAQDPNAGEGYS
jgi:adenylate kinase